MELALSRKILGQSYQSEAARSVKPKAIEQTVQKVRGIVGLLDVDGCVFDFKTSSKRPIGISAEHCLRLITYAMITSEASGLCRLDTMTKTKSLQVVQQSYHVGPYDLRFCRDPVSHGAGVDPGRNLPAPPSSPLCSLRYCGYWRDCERELGGRVAE